MRYFILILTMFFSINSLYSQEKQLTKEQKVNDFIYAYKILKENYPFFGVCKRQNGIDWLEKKNEYLKWINNTFNDSSYISTLKEIFNELNDGHVNFNATRFGNEGYHAAYKKLSIANPKYNNWLQMFENPNTRIKYWSEILIKKEKPAISNHEEKKKHQTATSNYSDTIINNGQIAIMTILSFNIHHIGKDKDSITSFLNKIGDCKYLVIDIQENSGGAVKYWVENIIEKLIHDTILYKSYPVIKDGKTNRHFNPDFFAQASVLEKDASLSQIPSELLVDKYYIKTSIDTLVPNAPVNFSGEIFLLVSKKVFSSAEGLAQFCKTTGWATIAGEKTGGDGIGSDPAIILLPESGILMSYPSLVGLNHDGSLNSEAKTTPDIVLDGLTPQERLKQLITYLENR